jgi:flagellin
MGLRVNTNVEAIGIHRNLILTGNNVSDSLKKLSSGYRIMSAKDDASGLAVANKFKSQISSLRVAYQNATESNAMLQVADGAYNKVHDILVRMKDLATQAAGGQIENSKRTQLNTEFGKLQEELDRIAKSTKYGGQTLVYGATAGGKSTFTFQIGATNADTDQIAVGLDSVSTAALAVNGLSISVAGSASSAMASIDAALLSINDFMANLGAQQNRLSHTMENISTMVENFSAAESAIRDVDMAFEVTKFTKSQILQQTGMAMLAQANQAPQQVLQLLGG